MLKACVFYPRAVRKQTGGENAVHGRCSTVRAVSSVDKSYSQRKDQECTNDLWDFIDRDYIFIRMSPIG